MPMRVIVSTLVYLDQDHGHPTVSVHANPTDAIKKLAGILADQWDRVAGRDGAAAEPHGLTATEIVNQYMRVRDGLDSYTVAEHIVDVTDQLSDLTPTKPS